MSEMKRRRQERFSQETNSIRQMTPAQSDDSVEIDLLEYFYRLLDSWKLIILCVLLCTALGFAYGRYRNRTPVYSATSTIYVVGTETAINVSTLQMGNYMAKDYIEVFDIWEVQDQVCRNLWLKMSYEDLRKMISISNPDNTRMLNITAKSKNPQEAADVANEFANVVSNYIADTMKTDKPSLMSVALVPTNPDRPRGINPMILGALLGIIIAAAWVMIRMLMDDKIKTAEDVMKYTGLTNLAVVPVDTGNLPDGHGGKSGDTRGMRGQKA